MKSFHALVCLIVLFAPNISGAQQAAEFRGPPVPSFADATNTFEGTDLPLIPQVDSVHSDWATKFSTDESRRDFKRLREYRSEKQTLLNQLRSQVETFRSLRETAGGIARARGTHTQYLRDLLRVASGDSIHVRRSLPVEYDEILGAYTPGFVQVSQVRELQQRLAEEDSVAKQYQADIYRSSLLLAGNIANLESDLRQCEAAIDSALEPEYRDMQFRTSVSAFFSILIGVMIISFFLIIYKRTEESIGSLLLSDGGLQFVTIFVLIIAIILFGILSILEGRELAAILSGIAGYILGRGAHMRTDRNRHTGNVSESDHAVQNGSNGPARAAIVPIATRRENSMPGSGDIASTSDRDETADRNTSSGDRMTVGSGGTTQ